VDFLWIFGFSVIFNTFLVNFKGPKLDWQAQDGVGEQGIEVFVKYLTMKRVIIVFTIIICIFTVNGGPTVAITRQVSPFALTKKDGSTVTITWQVNHKTLCTQNGFTVAILWQVKYGFDPVVITQHGIIMGFYCGAHSGTGFPSHCGKLDYFHIMKINKGGLIKTKCVEFITKFFYRSYVWFRPLQCTWSLELSSLLLPPYWSFWWPLNGSLGGLNCPITGLWG